VVLVVLMVLFEYCEGLGFGARVVAAFCGLNCLANLHGCKLSAKCWKTEEMELAYENMMEQTELGLWNWTSPGPGSR